MSHPTPSTSSSSRPSYLQGVPDIHFRERESLHVLEWEFAQYGDDLFNRGGELEKLIQRYSEVLGKLKAELSEAVLRNYPTFMQGMQLVQTVEREMSVVREATSSARSQLKTAREKLGSVHRTICSQTRRKQRLQELRGHLTELHALATLHEKVESELKRGDFVRAVEALKGFRNGLPSASENSLLNFPASGNFASAERRSQEN